MEKLEKTIRVLTFNIASGQKLDGSLDLELTAAEIEKMDADIIGLQEVDRHFSDRSDFVDQAKWLADRLGMFVAFGPNISYSPLAMDSPKRQYGNATLSKYPILSFQNHPLTSVPVEGSEDEPRGVLKTSFDINGKQFVFFNTHLSLRGKEVKVHIKELLEIARNSSLPAIVAGDFNAMPGSEHVKNLTQHFTNVFGAAENHPDTYKKRGDHGTKIDYILVDSNWKVERAEVIKTKTSDHYSILAELQLFTEP